MTSTTQKKRDTSTGALWEKKTSFEDTLVSLGYRVKTSGRIFKRALPLNLHSGQKNEFYKIYEEKFKCCGKSKVSWVKFPDDFIINHITKTAYICEKKSQQTEGSADEKICCGPIMKDFYEQIFEGTGYKVVFFYLLDGWFEQYKYTDALSLLKDKYQIPYFFHTIDEDFWSTMLYQHPCLDSWKPVPALNYRVS